MTNRTTTLTFPITKEDMINVSTEKDEKNIDVVHSSLKILYTRKCLKDFNDNNLLFFVEGISEKDYNDMIKNDFKFSPLVEKIHEKIQLDKEAQWSHKVKESVLRFGVQS